MKERSSWSSQEILWELGASFLDANADTATTVVQAAIERVALRLHGLAGGVWRVDLRTGRTTRVYGWAVEPSADVDDRRVRPDPELRAELGADREVAIVALERVLGEDLCRERGWSGGQAFVAVIDDRDEEIEVLVVGTSRSSWDDDAVDLIRGTVVLLRQFNRRIRAERRLLDRHHLDQLTVSLAARFQTVGAATLDTEVMAALTELRDVAGAQSVAMIDVIDDRTIGLPYMVVPHDVPSDWLPVSIPDMSRVPGADGRTIREYISEPRVVDLGDLVDAVMGPEVTAAFDLRNPPRRIALLPASIGEGDALLAVVRMGSAEWNSDEFDSLSTLASLIAQTRGRVAAERSSTRRLEAQRTLARIGAEFLDTTRADAHDALASTLERIGRHLDADFAVVSALGDDHDTVTVLQSWAADPRFTIPAGLSRRRSADDGWSSIVSPIRGQGLPASSLAFIWAEGRRAEVDDDRDIVRATADLVSQLNVRLRAEDEVNSRLALDELLAKLADAFLGATLETVDDVVGVALETFGEALGLDGVALRRIDTAESVVEFAWAPPGMPRPTAGDVLVLTPRDRMADRDHFEQASTDAKWSPVVHADWGAEATTTVLPVLVGGRHAAALVIVSPRDFADHEAEAFRGLAVMLGQLRGRIEEQRRGLRRLAAQRLLSECAAALAEATPDDVEDVVEAVLGQAGSFCDLEGVGIWQVDAPRERYVATCIWLRDHEARDELPQVLEWGVPVLLDRARTGGETVAHAAEPPSASDTSRLAIPRGEGGEVETILLAGTLLAGPWQEETVELLESLSQMTQEAEVRVAAQRYAQVAFASAPIGVVLRDEDLNLITCNQAFVDFVGAESVDELVGTAPQDVYDDPYEAIDWIGGREGELSAQAAFRGPGGSRVWGQMRASKVTGGKGNRFWLVHIEDVTDRRHSEQLLRFQASHDELTGLANRRRLLDEIRSVADGSGSVAVLLLDLDRFKNVNDSLGHDRGDELLVVIADRLRLAVRPGDLVARLGGDEFAVVLPGPVVVSDAQFVAERLMRLIGEPVSLGSQKIYPTVSIGIAVADEQTAVADLLRRADTAMYRAKAKGRARAEAFDEKLREAVHARMATESGLRGALRSDELIVHYQPEVSLPDRRLLGAEALVRWHHPEQGLLPASAFIEVAEETGLVVEIGEMVLAEACREAAAWSDGQQDAVIRVNLAAAQLQRDGTVALVQRVLIESGLAPARLCLEITESAVMSDVARSEEILHRLKDLGVHLAVDDFGTGFSSLAYLKRFPVDALKIDRAFVKDLGTDPEDHAFVRSIVSLADALGLDVVAEGVETELQAEVLHELGCRRAQGFLFAHPGPPAMGYGPVARQTP